MSRTLYSSGNAQFRMEFSRFIFPQEQQGREVELPPAFQEKHLRRLKYG